MENITKMLHTRCDLSEYFNQIIPIFDELKSIEQLLVDLRQIEADSQELLVFKLSLFNQNDDHSIKIVIEPKSSKNESFIPLQDSIEIPVLRPFSGINVVLSFMKLLPNIAILSSDLNIFIRNTKSNKIYKIPVDK